MSKLTKINETTAVLEDVYIAYPKLARPVVSTNDNGVETQKYEITVFMDGETFDDYELLGLKFNPKRVTLTPDEFKGRFKFDMPFKKTYQLTLRSNATFKDKATGEVKMFELGMRARPSCEVLEKGQRVSLLEATDKGVNYTKYIGFGSKAKVAIQLRENLKYGGTLASLAGVLITDFVDSDYKPTTNTYVDPFASDGAAPAMEKNGQVLGSAGDVFDSAPDFDSDDSIPF